MSKSQIYTPEINRYIPAVAHHNKAMGWIVEYYAYNPIKKDLDRKRFRLNNLRAKTSAAQFKMQVAEIVRTINNRLAGGWTPFGESENSRYYTSIADVMQMYIAEKTRELRPDSMRSYRSFCNIFGQWCDKNVPKIQCTLFNKVLAVKYMDYYYNDRNASGKTYNNHLKMARAFFAWAKEKCYCKENPFELMKTKKEEKKKRILIPADTRKQIKSYFEDKKPAYIAVMELVYTSLLRPTEICRIQIKQIDLQNGTIYMPPDKTKNGNERYAFLSEELCERLRQQIAGKQKDMYLFGTGYIPKKDPISSKMLRKDWDKMRKALQLPDEMQLYSLRDTGINNMLLAGIDPLTVMQAADHHDLAMTTRYANHANPNMIRTLSELAPTF